MKMNRDWLLDRDVLLPDSGHSAGYENLRVGNGHLHLFEDKTFSLFSDLRDELDQYEARGGVKALLSFEGVSHMGERRLTRIAAELSGHDITIIAYLREQSEVIQSGYFQATKQRPQKRVIGDYQRSEKLTTPKHIDYAHTLGKFERVFGRENILVRIYERDQLLDGDIVRDFLDLLGLQQDSEFIQSPGTQNISLDPGSVFLLNIIDNYFDDPEGREKLVDSLLNDIQCHGAQGKYFLKKERVDSIREHYHASNQAVARRYLGRSSGELFSFARPTYATDQADYAEFCADKVKRLHELVDYRPWDGKVLKGERLQQVASPAAGWARAEHRGVWSDREESVIRFRLMRFRTNPFAKWLVINIKGHYFHNNTTTSISGPGLEDVELSLDDAKIKIPLNALDANASVDLRLRHTNPVSPASLGKGDDQRRLAFALKQVGFSVVD